MGLLAEGKPLIWDEAKKYADHIRQHGVSQFLCTWEKNRDREGDVETWGDEVESMVILLDDTSKTAKLSLRQMEIIEQLQNIPFDNDLANSGGVRWAPPLFDPEFGSYMIESSPGEPYSAELQDLLKVEPSMRYRRKLADAHMKSNEFLLTLSSFPRLGATGIYSEPQYQPGGEANQSLFLPDEIMNAHPRFVSLAANIRLRRGRKVAINVPIFVDQKTPRPFIEADIPRANKASQSEAGDQSPALRDHIYMDAVGFGAGCCCVQMTLQTKNLSDARRLYDALVPVAPIMLALSAASPAYRGFLSDVDCRWNVIRDAADDRTEEELGVNPMQGRGYRIPKSRYDSASSYISASARNHPEYSDISMPINEDIYKRLKDHGVDEPLAQHVAHLFIRDPIVVLEEDLYQDDTTSTGHFDNISSTNWQTLRLKLPPQCASLADGWRVEFRSTEAQITDFENAAFSIFIVLLSRAILYLDVDLYMPISKVDENMGRAQKRDAALREQFWFRSDISSRLKATKDALMEAAMDSCGLMSIDEIINGKRDGSTGLMGLIDRYLETANVELQVARSLQPYLDLIRRRANGSLMTTAAWTRRFIRAHPVYNFDSVINEEIAYDLVKAFVDLGRGIGESPSSYRTVIGHHKNN